MAIFTVPFTTIYLVPHVGGGALLHAGGGYVTNTLIPAAAVEAFGVASGVLSQIGGAAAAAGSTMSLPVIAGVATLAVAAAGGYCYFHGIPASIEASLSSAGLGTASKQGFAVSVPQLAVALIALGGAGYIAYRFYRNFTSIRAARLFGSAPDVQSMEQAETTVRGAFGHDAWSKIGAAIWANMEDVGQAATATAQDAVNASVALAERLVAAATDAALVVKETIATTAIGATGLAGSFGSSGQAAMKGAGQVSADVANRALRLVNVARHYFSRAR